MRATCPSLTRCSQFYKSGQLHKKRSSSHRFKRRRPFCILLKSLKTAHRRFGNNLRCNVFLIFVSDKQINTRKSLKTAHRYLEKVNLNPLRARRSPLRSSAWDWSFAGRKREEEDIVELNFSTRFERPAPAVQQYGPYRGHLFSCFCSQTTTTWPFYYSHTIIFT